MKLPSAAATWPTAMSPPAALVVFNNDSKNPASSRYVQLGEPRLIMLEGKYSF